MVACEVLYSRYGKIELDQYHQTAKDKVPSSPIALSRLDTQLGLLFVYFEEYHMFDGSLHFNFSHVV